MYGDCGNDYIDDQSSYRGGGANGFGDKFDVDFGSKLKQIDWELNKLPIFDKNFYVEHPAVKARSEAKAEDWRRHHSIAIVGRGVPKVSQRIPLQDQLTIPCSLC